MDDEEVDIIDDKNNILYSVTKSQAHRKGLLHRTVIAELRDSKGNIILVKQAADRQDAGQYVSPVGGHVRAGESEIEALRREALEEIGLTNFRHAFMGRVKYRRTVLGRDENHCFVLFEIFSDDPITLGVESVHYELFTEQRLRQELQENPTKFGAAFFVILKKFYPQLLS